MMQVNDFIQDFKSGENVLDKINIKGHLTFIEKYNLLEQVKNNGIDTVDDVTTYDSMTGDFLFGIAVVMFYTDLKFGENSLDEFDELCRLGLYDRIINSFEHEYRLLRKYYNEKVQAILAAENDSNNILNRQILAVSNKAIETLDAITKKLDKKLLNKFIQNLTKP
jgi:hypothetical protein